MSISGKYLEVEIGSTAVAGAYDWDADEDGGPQGRTTGADEGYRNADPGIMSGDVNIKGYMDVATGQYAQVRAQTVITNLKLYRDASDAEPAFSFPSALVVKSHQGAIVEGKVEWTATIWNQGPYDYNDPT